MIRIHTERNNSQETGKIKMQNAKDVHPQISQIAQMEILYFSLKKIRGGKPAIRIPSPVF
jgi:hypothetical protein